jgi:hypothetical protein
MTSEVKAAATYAIKLAIMDDTTSAITTYTILKGGPLDTNPNPNAITLLSALDTSGTGVSITGVNSNTGTSASGAFLNISGSATVVPGPGTGSMDKYTIVITTTHDSYTLPSGTSEFLSQSESSTYSFTNAGNTQSFQSYDNPGSAPGVTAGITPGPQLIPIRPAGLDTLSGSSNNPGNTSIPGYVVPYTLTSQITIVVTGNGTALNSNIQFADSTVVSDSPAGVPEPRSFVALLMGLSVPLAMAGGRLHRKARRPRDRISD